MNRRLWISGGLFMVLGTFAGLRFNTLADEGVRPIPNTLGRSVDDESAPVMHAKLTASQRVLEGLLNRDFKTISTAAEILSQLAVAAHQHQEQDRDDLIYEHFRTEFIRLSEQLETMAEDENLEGAAYVHQSLTATCIACHRHLRDRDDL